MGEGCAISERFLWKLDFFIRREVVFVEDFIGEILFALLKNTRALEDGFF